MSIYIPTHDLIIFSCPSLNNSDCYSKPNQTHHFGQRQERKATEEQREAMPRRGEKVVRTIKTAEATEDTREGREGGAHSSSPHVILSP
jgi:hypothetical protein